MANIYPFRGLRYSPGIPIKNVVTQPYDKISKGMQDRYYALHPNNIIRIVLGRSEPGDSDANNVYTRASGFLKEWRSTGILEHTPEAAFFAYFQRFTIPGTIEVTTRKGFVGLARLEDYSNKVVFPHERTLTGPKRDRLELLRHTRTHFEQIFMLYEDPAQGVDRVLEQTADSPPDIDVEDEFGVTHRVWVMTDSEKVRFIQEKMTDKKLIIADGHHRYETALAYRDEMRVKYGLVPNAAYERIPMTFFNMDSPGLTILPTHRVLSRLEGFQADSFFERSKQFFDASISAFDAGSLRSELNRLGKDQVTIGVAVEGEGTCFLLRLKPSLDLASVLPDLTQSLRTLDVVVLHRLIIEKCLGITEDAVKRESHIMYVREFDKALNAVKSGGAQIAFLLNATRLDQMRDIALEGNVMPQKSTDFYPKVLSGLVMYSLEEE